MYNARVLRFFYFVVDPEKRFAGHNFFGLHIFFFELPMILKSVMSFNLGFSGTSIVVAMDAIAP